MKWRRIILLSAMLVAFHAGFAASPSSTPNASPSPEPTPSLSPTPIHVDKSAMKPASELISKQQGPTLFPEILKNAAGEPVSVVVSLSKQRVYLLIGGKVAIDSPISSGKRNGWTPKGEFVILEKDPNHQSNLYGNFVDSGGRVVRSGISSKLDVAPSGTHYRGAPMKYFMRLTPEGVGMHVGILPGYPASHGCIRLPLEMAKLIYSKVDVKTPVTIAD